jgi:hypothetical protein
VWLVAPAAKRGFNLFVDPVADRLHNFRLDHVSLGVDGDLDDYISLQVVGKCSAVHGRIGIYDRIGDVDFMPGDRSVNHRAQRRSGAGIVVASFGTGGYLLRFWRSLDRPPRAWAWLAGPRREQQSGGVRERIAVAGGRRKVNQLGVGAVSIGEPGGG